jgi:hypothetical protein
VPACNSAFYDKVCCTRINERMPREPYGGMKAFKTFADFEAYVLGIIFSKKKSIENNTYLTTKLKILFL